MEIGKLKQKHYEDNVIWKNNTTSRNRWYKNYGHSGY